jgi:hypothetical protein
MICSPQSKETACTIRLAEAPARSSDIAEQRGISGDGNRSTCRCDSITRLVNFWSTGQRNEAQNSRKANSARTARLSETAKNCKRTQRFSPKSHPGGRRFESG